MKTSIWDILTGLVLLGILCLIIGFVAIMANPAVAFNPLKPPQPVPTIAIIIPTPTETEMALPPTWTPTPDASQPKPGQEATLRPTSTPIPTATLVVLPTFTPSKSPRPTVGGISGGSCQVIYQDPQDEAVKKPSSAFVMRWTVKNTGKDEWRSDSVDLRFLSGARMHSGSDVRDLPYGVPSDSAVDLLVNMTTPSTEGTYTSNWALSAGTRSLCNFYVVLKVTQ